MHFIFLITKTFFYIVDQKFCLNFVGDQRSLANALTDEEPTNYLSGHQCVDPGLPCCEFSPSEGDCRLNEFGGLANSLGDLGWAWGHQLNLTILDEGGKPGLGEFTNISGCLCKSGLHFDNLEELRGYLCLEK